METPLYDFICLAEDGIRNSLASRALGDVSTRQQQPQARLQRVDIADLDTLQRGARRGAQIQRLAAGDLTARMRFTLLGAPRRVHFVSVHLAVKKKI